MKRLLALAAASLLLAGCTLREDRAEAQSKALNQSSYGRDGRTGLCFNTTFIIVNGNYQFSHTNVPCTPEVQAQIRKPEQ
ncbi:hypothetical protein CcrC1_gp362 [Caulobacter phage C1]|nr:hypothetical protein CcrC1_gp362 [Caulobacter phage C1]UTU08591.1 hypothetical protein CcrC2_gp363 [Caulobacter phage C2]UTU09107.1 hypothetical protein CcrJ4_gp358 [Caulobacter phage J4]UTU10224.1 hypothetical protein CcrRB23_gp362 [Caulobacter phage RB23]WGN97258.1 hypothetical protein [Bertelyvirus sp.]